METIIYFRLGSLHHYGPVASWKSEWTSVISVLKIWKKKTNKLFSSYYTYANRAMVFNPGFKKINVRLALDFWNVFSGADSAIINLIQDNFDLMTRPTVMALMNAALWEPEVTWIPTALGCVG